MVNSRYIDPRFEETPLCDDEVIVLSTLGKGPKGDKGEKGDPVTEKALYDAVSKYIESHYISTAIRPENAINGSYVFDINIKKPIWFYNGRWYTADGTDVTE